ncbi:SRPBCC family protein [Plantactinospora sp. CA-290183]|uniref:SRPBCC family protein n=1 Tax=Plantactinospora sp. CA-290183 TaxID=3240006 RepID=UPI003D924109
MARSGSFGYIVQARCAVPAALRLLADLDRQAELHPLILRVRARPPRPGALRSHLITDRLAWGPIRFRTTYRADTLLIGADELVIRAEQWPRTSVRNHTRLVEEPDGLVRVEVTITLSAPTPLFRYAFRQARAAHLALAARLPAALEAAGREVPDGGPGPGH